MKHVEIHIWNAKPPGKNNSNLQWEVAQERVRFLNGEAKLWILSDLMFFSLNICLQIYKNHQFPIFFDGTIVCKLVCMCWMTGWAGVEASGRRKLQKDVSSIRKNIRTILGILFLHILELLLF